MRMYISTMCLVVMSLVWAMNISEANASTAAKASSEGEGMRVNSVVLNGDWEFVIGNGDEHAETPDGADGLKWQKIILPGPFMAWNQEVANNTRFVWTRRIFTASAVQAADLAVLRWNQISSGAVAFINGARSARTPPPDPTK
jgi:hypothetical protein